MQVWSTEVGREGQATPQCLQRTRCPVTEPANQKKCLAPVREKVQSQDEIEQRKVCAVSVNSTMSTKKLLTSMSIKEN